MVKYRYHYITNALFFQQYEFEIILTTSKEYAYNLLFILE
ncbi:hypothetical protein bthur0013_7880 [Bacillus thuringiensis IBL 200]|nr:hypothetical protein bthur0013_7880 [Bacillus thuringiensis IBL 200]